MPKDYLVVLGLHPSLEDLVLRAPEVYFQQKKTTKRILVLEGDENPLLRKEVQKQNANKKRDALKEIGKQKNSNLKNSHIFEKIEILITRLNLNKQVKNQVIQDDRDD